MPGNWAVKAGKVLLAGSGIFAIIGGGMCALTSGYGAIPGMLVLLLAAALAILGALLLLVGFVVQHARR